MKAKIKLQMQASKMQLKPSKPLKIVITAPIEIICNDKMLVKL